MNKFKYIIIFISIFLLWLIIPAISYFVFDNWNNRGLFGDSFGVVNSLFSGLAFAGLIIAILLQREELKLQREELKLTRNEVKRSAEAQENQVHMMLKGAQINGIAALIQYNDDVIAHYRGATGVYPELTEAKRKNKQLTKELERILSEWSNFY